MHIHLRVCQLTSLRDAYPMLLRHGTTQRCKAHRSASVAGELHLRPSAGHGMHHASRSGPRRQRSTACQCQATGTDSSSEGIHAFVDLDSNQLQTALQIAVAAEDFPLAGAIRDELRSRRAASGDAGGASWRELGVPEWLADRAEQFGLRFPTEVQLRAAGVLRERRDCVIQSETGSGKTLSFLMPVLSALDYPPETPLSDFEGPQALVLVPTRELGVQIAMLVFRLFGGSVNAGIPGAAGNMFQYKGPRSIKVRGVLDAEEAAAAREGGGLGRAHVVVATPAALASALAGSATGASGAGRPPLALERLKFLVVDEVDACFQANSAEMESLLTAAATVKPKPAVVFVGATVQGDLTATAAHMGWMEDPATVAVGRGGVPRALRHVSIACDSRHLVPVLCRCIRADLKAQGDDAPTARAVVFAESEEQAAALAEPLRNALWGEHALAVLLPSGQEPIKAMQAFRDNAATLLVATPAAARGLDLPAVSTVYNTCVPADATDYLHRAGRAGRIGASVLGTVLTLVPPEQAARLGGIAGELGIEIETQEAPQAELLADAEGQRRALDDLYNLY